MSANAARPARSMTPPSWSMKARGCERSMKKKSLKPNRSLPVKESAFCKALASSGRKSSARRARKPNKLWRGDGERSQRRLKQKGVSLWPKRQPSQPISPVKFLGGKSRERTRPVHGGERLRSEERSVGKEWRSG